MLEASFALKSKSYLDEIARSNLLFSTTTNTDKDEHQQALSALLNYNNISNSIRSFKDIYNNSSNYIGKGYFPNLLDEFFKNVKEEEVKNNHTNNNRSSLESNNIEVFIDKHNKQNISKPIAVKDCLKSTHSLTLDKMDIVVEEQEEEKLEEKINDSNNNQNLNFTFDDKSNKTAFNDFSFNKNYFLALVEASDSSSGAAACPQKDMPKIIVRNPTRKLSKKIFENFTNYLYMCIKSNESYIDFFKIFLEEQKLNLLENLCLEHNNVNNSNNIKMEEEDKYSKTFFYKNFQNMLLNLIDSSDRNIKEIKSSYAKKYEYIEMDIRRLDINIDKLRDITSIMKKDLEFLDNYWERNLAKYGSA